MNDLIDDNLIEETEDLEGAIGALEREASGRALYMRQSRIPVCRGKCETQVGAAARSECAVDGRYDLLRFQWPR